MSGIQFITDEAGRRTAVVIDLKKHSALWEDVQDVLISQERSSEKGVSLSAVKADLVKRVPSYRVELKPSARKELERLPDRTLERVFKHLEGLAAEPRPRGCKKLVGGSQEWRIRVG